MANLAAGTSSGISAASGDGVIDGNVGDNHGRGDTWLSYEHAHPSPGVRVRITGNLWWKPKFTPPSAFNAPKIRVFMVRTENASGALNDISPSSGMLFSNFATSPTYSLSAGSDISKVPFSFSQSISATVDSADSKTYMWMLGMNVVDLDGTNFLGQSSTTSVAGNNTGMVADVELAIEFVGL